MKSNPLICTALIAFALTSRIIAGNIPAGDENQSIKGIIVDARDQSPLEFANIVLKSAADSSMTSATYSGKTGEFILPNIPRGTYYLRITYIGYEAKIIANIVLSEGNPVLDLGTVPMNEKAVSVGDVTVEAARPMEEFHLDKKVINVAQNPGATGGTALDVLRNQPSVQVDASDNVTLRGSSTFTVLVNGRPGTFQGADALKQIPANIIENIELITNPSAKYDAEGAAGIININLKKETQDTRGIMNLTAGSRDKYSGDISLNHSIGPVSISGGVEYSNNTYWQNQDVLRNTDSPTGALVNITSAARRDTRKQYNFRLGADYTIDDWNVVSITGSAGKVDMSRRFSLSVNDQTPDTSVYTFIHNDFGLAAPYYSTGLNYTHKFEPKVSELTANNSYTSVDLPYSQHTNEFETDASFANRMPNPLLQWQDNDNWRYENTSKIDYFYQVSEQSRLELGAQSRFSKRVYDVYYGRFDWPSDAWMTDMSRTNRFEYDNNIHAAYATYSNSLADFAFQTGIRAEYTDRLLRQKTLGEDYAYQEADWFPSASISRRFGAEQAQFSYSRRINRPDELQLNPFPYYSDSYYTSAGSPHLLPEYVNSYELNFQHTAQDAFYSAQTYYRTTTNAVWHSQSVDENGHLTTAFNNFARTASLGVELSSSYTAADWLRFDPNVNLSEYTLQGSAYGDNIDVESFVWTARLNTTFTLSPSTTLQVSGMYFSRQIAPQTTVDPRFYMSVVARQNFFSKAMTVTASASNLFTSAYYNVTGSGANFDNNFIIKPEVPSVNLTLSYNVNNYSRDRGRINGVDVNVGG